MVTGSTDHGGGSFDHRALVVDADDTIRRVLLPHLHRKIASHQAVLMVVGGGTEAIVRDHLGSAAHDLQWAPTNAFYQRTGFTYSKFLRYLRERHTQQQVVHIVAEPDVVTDAATHVDRAAAYMGYEAMANEVYTCYRCSITCIWHSHRQSRSTIDAVRQVHRREMGPRGVVDSPAYMAPADYLSRRAQMPLPAVPPEIDLDLTVFHPEEVAGCRAVVARWASMQHFVPTAVRQVVAATSEVVANGLRHGRPPVRVRTWNQDTTLVVDVEDRGGRPVPTHAGYRPPVTPADSAGLWVARQLADVLLTHTGEGRTTVRMYFPYAVTHLNLSIPT